MKLQTILAPPAEFDDAEKGDALYGMLMSNLFLGHCSRNFRLR